MLVLVPGGRQRGRGRRCLFELGEEVVGMEVMVCESRGEVDIAAGRWKIADLEKEDEFLVGETLIGTLDLF